MPAVSEIKISSKYSDTFSIESHNELSVSLKTCPGLPESYSRLEIDIVLELFSNRDENSKHAETTISLDSMGLLPKLKAYFLESL